MTGALAGAGRWHGPCGGVALVLGVVQATGLAIWLEQQTGAADGLPLVAEPGWSFRLTLVLTVTTITACLIWLSDEISRRGIGWGVSLLFFAGLVVGLPGAVSAIQEQMRAGYIGPAGLAAFAVGLLIPSGSSCSSIRPGGGTPTPG